MLYKLLGKLFSCLDLKHINLKHSPFSFRLFLLSLKFEHANFLLIHNTVLKLFGLKNMISTYTRNCLDTLHVLPFITFITGVRNEHYNYLHSHLIDEKADCKEG